jgi:hypothetical protein
MTNIEPVASIVPCYTPSGKRVALNTRHQGLPIGTVLYTEAQILQLVEACAAAVEPELVDPEDQDEAFQSKKASAARIRNMIKELLPAAELAKQEAP